VSENSAEARYAAYAKAREMLLGAAAKRIPIVSLAAQARALNLWRHNRVEPGSEAQFACVMDLAVFSPVGGHKPALQRVVQAGAPPADGAEAAMLSGLIRTRFSLFRMGERDRRGGIGLHDLCSGEDIWLMDRHLAEFGRPGLLMGARLSWPDEFAMTCGVIVPVDPRVLLALMENRAPLTGPVPAPIEPRPNDPLITQLLTEEIAPSRLKELGEDPLLATNTYRAALDHGLLGPVPGR
jgi:hypothetical protein